MDLVKEQLLDCLCLYRQGSGQVLHTKLTGQNDWQNLRKLADMHKLGPVVYDTLRQTADFCGGDAVMAAAWRRESMMQAVAQAAKSSRLLALTSRLEQENCPYALLKGLLCRELYSRPDLRLSGDEDLFIRTEDRERCSRLLTEEGLHCTEQTASVTHWQDERTGLHIELHTCLFPPMGSGKSEAADRLNILFAGQLQHPFYVSVADTYDILRLEGNGTPVRTFAPTESFVFLVCHALKHFVAGGTGVRTLCDVLSFAEKYKEEIQHPAVEEIMRLVHGRGFLDQIFALGQRELGFDPAACGWEILSAPDTDTFLADCLEAGIYGNSTAGRQHSASLVLEAGASGSMRLGRVLFPTRRQLLHRYPELEKWPVLLPLCWVRRLGKYGCEVLRSRAGEKNSPAQSLELGRKRTEMMVRYGIFTQSKKEN